MLLYKDTAIGAIRMLTKSRRAGSKNRKIVIALFRSKLFLFFIPEIPSPKTI